MRRTLLACSLALICLVPGLGWTHAERATLSPPRPGHVPDQNRAPTETIDVCKTGECTFQHIQAAVTAAHDGALIQIWPGFYREEPSRAMPELPPDDPPENPHVYSYQHHIDHPNSVNLIAIVGKKNITLRGMGANPRDVVIDVEFKKHVGIRGDRSDGLILENFSVWHAYDHGVYVLDTDGFIIDRVHSGYSREYPFLTFANDHGLMRNCEAFGGGDGGLYPGGAADAAGGKLGRYSMEIDHCRSYHNVLGYSGTQGDNVWVHDSEFFDNATGLVSDSETDHPNYPENNLVLERNKFHDNNLNVYQPDSDIRATVFTGFAAIPVGVGVLLATGNDNLVQNNDIWGNDRYGVALWSGEGLVLGPTSTPAALPLMSTGNRFLANRMYGPPGSKPNLYDFACDGFGTNNCWQDNVRSPGGDAATSEVIPLPPCNNPVDGSVLPLTAGPPNPISVYYQAGILVVADSDGDGVDDRPICDFTDTCGYDWQSPGPPLEKARNEPEGYQPPPTPPTCGPSTCPAASRTTVRGTKTTRSFRVDASKLPATGVGAPMTGALALIAASALTLGVLRRRA